MRGLLLDDDALYRNTLARALQRRGIAMLLAASADEALEQVRAQPPDFALIDLKLAEGDGTGLDLIAPLRAAAPAMRIVLVTGYASVATAVEAIKRGADDYLPKPSSVDAILHAVGAITSTQDVVAPPEPAAMTPLARIEWEHIQQALTETDGNISAAARLLGMHRRSLQRKLAKRPPRG
ncbi:response regulator [Denitratimonas sp. CY0512]|uniref:response regulator transcription factor n=1 Tax=Denitratimonas sp. CY0512 TaxID=3131940 RepID=UPI0030985EBF